MSVKIELTFDSLEEAASFLGSVHPNAPAPTDLVLAQPSTAPIPAKQPEQNPPADPIKALREAASNLIARLPAGQGPVKVRELLQTQGITKFADATPQQAVTLTALMEAVK